MVNIKIITFFSIVGALLVSFNYCLYANLIWSLTNPLLAIHNKRIEQKEQMWLFSIFSIIAWFGVINFLI